MTHNYPIRTAPNYGAGKTIHALLRSPGAKLAPAMALVAFGPCPGEHSVACTGRGIQTVDPVLCLPESTDPFGTTIMCGACYAHQEHVAAMRSVGMWT